MSLLQESALPASVAGPAAWEGLPAAQQPHWRYHPDYLRTREELALAPPLVSMAELDALQRALATVAAGDACLLQAGDCAESLAECTPAAIEAKLAVLHSLADTLTMGTGRLVVRIGRMGGQFAKPRSQAVEWHRDQELPAFRGHMVNSELPTVTARQHDPGRMLCAYRASAQVHRALAEDRRQRVATGSLPGESGAWSSHEALVIDYEGSVIRIDPATGCSFLGSTHLPWVGERTRQPQSVHVRLLSSVRNPVGCKLGPATGAADVARLCELLDPDRVPGRLVLIVRMGASRIREALPPLVAAVRQAGHPVTWVSDPMHGNTVRSTSGLKTRHLPDMIAEAVTFRSILERAGEHPAGLHLEVAASEVTECVGGPVREEMLPHRYTTLCDPRLNSEQAHELIRAWT
ncbi:MAG TPA: 3-deoxy-7-phosphoheptulonate synthase [Pseudonocardiaceae bacterium]|jgi:3-deoxy-7-phosphoheptulonate synthase|nr:3-deoxy-7-phosphoheptulonate synthase [Pseudonocardiaceae bacterium]